MDAKFEHEYFVKFKTMSYVHVQWLTAQEIGKHAYALPFSPCSV